MNELSFLQTHCKLFSTWCVCDISRGAERCVVELTQISFSPCKHMIPRTLRLPRFQPPSSMVPSEPQRELLRLPGHPQFPLRITTLHSPEEHQQAIGEKLLGAILMILIKACRSIVCLWNRA